MQKNKVNERGIILSSVDKEKLSSDSRNPFSDSLALRYAFLEVPSPPVETHFTPIIPPTEERAKGLATTIRAKKSRRKPSLKNAFSFGRFQEEKEFLSQLTRTLCKVYHQNAFIDRLLYPPPEGKRLPIHACYTHLAIVDNEYGKIKEHALKESACDVDKYEDIHTVEQSQETEIKDLFSAKEGDLKIPRRILLLGRAGVGKSTLSRYIAEGWAQGAFFSERYQLLVWLPLRAIVNVTNTLEDTSCEGFELMAAIMIKVHGLPFSQTKIAMHLKKLSDKKQLLFVLDGYDEVAPFLSQLGTCQGILRTFLDYSDVLITSRPYQIRGGFNPVDRIVENLGFTNEHIPHYIARFFENFHPSRLEWGQLCLTWLARQTHIWNMAHVPLNLELICSVWERAKSRGQLLSRFTHTQLFTKILNNALEQCEARQYHLSIYQEYEPDFLYQKYGFAIAALEALAFYGMDKGLIVIPAQIVNSILAQVSTLPISLARQVLNRIGLIKPTNINALQDEQFEQDYYFIHLSFQERLAAQFVQRLMVKGFETTASCDIQNWIVARRYQPRLIEMLGYVASLLKEEWLTEFFKLLLLPPNDTAGIYQVLLLLRCIEESQVFLSSDVLEWLIEKITNQVRRYYQVLVDVQSSHTTPYLPLLKPLGKALSANPKLVAHRKMVKLCKLLFKSDHPLCQTRRNNLSNWQAFSLGLEMSVNDTVSQKEPTYLFNLNVKEKSTLLSYLSSFAQAPFVDNASEIKEQILLKIHTNPLELLPLLKKGLAQLDRRELLFSMQKSQSSEQILHLQQIINPAYQSFDCLSILNSSKKRFWSHVRCSLKAFGRVREGILSAVEEKYRLQETKNEKIKLCIEDCRIMLLGATCVGKTALVNRYLEQHFSPGPTIEDSYRKLVEIDTMPIMMHIMDSSGLEEFGVLRDSYMKTGQVFIVCYSVTSNASFAAAQKLIAHIPRVCDGFRPFVLVATKGDLEDERQVTQEQGEALASKYNTLFMQTSVKDDVDLVFENAVRFQQRASPYRSGLKDFLFLHQVFFVSALKVLLEHQQEKEIDEAVEKFISQLIGLWLEKESVQPLLQDAFLAGLANHVNMRRYLLTALLEVDVEKVQFSNLLKWACRYEEVFNEPLFEAFLEKFKCLLVHPHIRINKDALISFFKWGHTQFVYQHSCVKMAAVLLKNDADEMRLLAGRFLIESGYREKYIAEHSEAQARNLQSDSANTRLTALELLSVWCPSTSIMRAALIACNRDINNACRHLALQILAKLAQGDEQESTIKALLDCLVPLQSLESPQNKPVWAALQSVNLESLVKIGQEHLDPFMLQFLLWNRQTAYFFEDERLCFYDETNQLCKVSIQGHEKKYIFWHEKSIVVKMISLLLRYDIQSLIEKDIKDIGYACIKVEWKTFCSIYIESFWQAKFAAIIKGKEGLSSPFCRGHKFVKHHNCSLLQITFRTEAAALTLLIRIRAALGEWLRVHSLLEKVADCLDISPKTLSRQQVLSLYELSSYYVQDSQNPECFNLDNSVIEILEPQHQPIMAYARHWHFSVAVLENYADIVEQLLCCWENINLNVNQKDRWTGRTPLHWAALKEHSVIVTLLLQAGAELYVQDNEGKTPFVGEVFYQKEWEALAQIACENAEPLVIPSYLFYQKRCELVQLLKDAFLENIYFYKKNQEPSVYKQENTEPNLLVLIVWPLGSLKPRAKDRPSRLWRIGERLSYLLNSNVKVVDNDKELKAEASKIIALEEVLKHGKRQVDLNKEIKKILELFSLTPDLLQKIINQPISKTLNQLTSIQQIGLIQLGLKDSGAKCQKDDNAYEGAALLWAPYAKRWNIHWLCKEPITADSIELLRAILFQPETSEAIYKEINYLDSDGNLPLENILKQLNSVEFGQPAFEWLSEAIILLLQQGARSRWPLKLLSGRTAANTSKAKWTRKFSDNNPSWMLLAEDKKYHSYFLYPTVMFNSSDYLSARSHTTLMKNPDVINAPASSTLMLKNELIISTTSQFTSLIEALHDWTSILNSVNGFELERLTQPIEEFVEKEILLFYALSGYYLCDEVQQERFGLDKLLAEVIEPKHTRIMEYVRYWHPVVAVLENHITIIKQLLRYQRRIGWDIQRTDIHGRTCLHWAAVKQRNVIAALLLKEGANPYTEDKEGRTPFGQKAFIKHEYQSLKRLTEEAEELLPISSCLVYEKRAELGQLMQRYGIQDFRFYKKYEQPTSDQHKSKRLKPSLWVLISWFEGSTKNFLLKLDGIKQALSALFPWHIEVAEGQDFAIEIPKTVSLEDTLRRGMQQAELRKEVNAILINSSLTEELLEIVQQQALSVSLKQLDSHQRSGLIQLGLLSPKVMGGKDNRYKDDCTYTVLDSLAQQWMKYAKDWNVHVLCKKNITADSLVLLKLILTSDETQEAVRIEINQLDNYDNFPLESLLNSLRTAQWDDPDFEFLCESIVLLLCHGARSRLVEEFLISDEQLLARDGLYHYLLSAYSKGKANTCQADVESSLALNAAEKSSDIIASLSQQRKTDEHLASPIPPPIIIYQPNYFGEVNTNKFSLAGSKKKYDKFSPESIGSLYPGLLGLWALPSQPNSRTDILLSPSIPLGESHMMQANAHTQTIDALLSTLPYKSCAELANYYQSLQQKQAVEPTEGEKRELELLKKQLLVFIGTMKLKTHQQYADVLFLAELNEPEIKEALLVRFSDLLFSAKALPSDSILLALSQLLQGICYSQSAINQELLYRVLVQLLPKAVELQKILGTSQDPVIHEALQSLFYTFNLFKQHYPNLPVDTLKSVKTDLKQLKKTLSFETAPGFYLLLEQLDKQRHALKKNVASADQAQSQHRMAPEARHGAVRAVKGSGQLLTGTALLAAAITVAVFSAGIFSFTVVPAARLFVNWGVKGGLKHYYRGYGHAGKVYSHYRKTQVVNRSLAIEGLDKPAFERLATELNKADVQENLLKIKDAAEGAEIIQRLGDILLYSDPSQAEVLSGVVQSVFSRFYNLSLSNGDKKTRDRKLQAFILAKSDELHQAGYSGFPYFEEDVPAPSIHTIKHFANVFLPQICMSISEQNWVEYEALQRMSEEQKKTLRDQNPEFWDKFKRIDLLVERLTALIEPPLALTTEHYFHCGPLWDEVFKGERRLIEEVDTLYGKLISENYPSEKNTLLKAMKSYLHKHHLLFPNPRVFLSFFTTHLLEAFSAFVREQPLYCLLTLEKKMDDKKQTTQLGSLAHFGKLTVEGTMELAERETVLSRNLTVADVLKYESGSTKIRRSDDKRRQDKGISKRPLTTADKTDVKKGGKIDVKGSILKDGGGNPHLKPAAPPSFASPALRDSPLHSVAPTSTRRQLTQLSQVFTFKPIPNAANPDEVTLCINYNLIKEQKLSLQPVLQSMMGSGEYIDGSKKSRWEGPKGNQQEIITQLGFYAAAAVQEEIEAAWEMLIGKRPFPVPSQPLSQMSEVFEIKARVNGSPGEVTMVIHYNKLNKVQAIGLQDELHRMTNLGNYIEGTVVFAEMEGENRGNILSIDFNEEETAKVKAETVCQKLINGQPSPMLLEALAEEQANSEFASQSNQGAVVSPLF